MCYRQSADSYIIYFIRKNLHTILPSIIKKYKYTESWVDFNNKVYCVTIPNHVVYIRRNGIPVWCGNSDPAMNRRLSKLDNIALISNSDSHSLRKIGREANIFNTELSYNGIINVIKSGGPRFVSTIEFFPEEGKYHYDGHRACEICLSPEKTKKLKNICPKCGEKLTIGVMNRVDELADREIGKDFVPYRNLIPLGEIIAEAFDVGENTKQVKKEYEKLIKTFGNELKILMEISESELKSVADPRVAESIKRVREGKVKIRPGYDGEYGEIKIFTDEEREKLKNQGSLF